MKKSLSFRSLGIIACGVLLTTAQAWAIDDRQQKMDWEESLNLTEEQENKIDEIENRYRQSFHDMKSSDMDKDIHQNLHNQMREEIRGVLTPEQQALAEKQIEEHRESRQNRNLNRLQKNLGLTDQQRTTLEAELANREPASWPVDKEQQDADRDHFERVLNGILTSEQKAQWELLQEQRRNKWAHHGEKHMP